MNEEPKPVRLSVPLLLQCIYYRWRLVVIPMIVLPLALLLLSDWLPKKYNASAQVLVQESMSVNPFLEDMQVPWRVNDRIPIMQAIIRSRMTLEKVLRELDEVDDTTSFTELDSKIVGLRKQIVVWGTAGGLVTIQCIGSNPDRIHTILKFVVDILIEAMLRPQKQSLEDASGFLEKQLVKVHAALIDIEQKIEEFKKENASELPEVFRANLDAYMSNQNALLAAATELRAARTRRVNLDQRLRVYNPIARELESSLIEARTRLGELRAVYTEEHPEIIALKEHIRQLRAERKAANLQLKKGKLDLGSIESAARLQSGIVVGQGATGGSRSGSSVEHRAADIVTSDLLEYKALSAEIASLKGAVSSLKAHGKETMESVRSFASTERVLNELVREQEVKQNTYTSLLEKYEEAKVTKALSMYDEDKQIVLIEAPRKPTSPIGITGDLFLVVLIGCLFGMLFGISVIVVVEFFSKSIRSVAELKAIVDFPVIGTLPRIYIFPPESGSKKA